MPSARKTNKTRICRRETYNIWIFHSVQTSGLGGLKPNTVIVGWPYGWRQSEDDRTWHVFLHTVRAVTAARMAMLVPKGINFFPDSNEKVSLRYIVLKLFGVVYGEYLL